MKKIILLFLLFANLFLVNVVFAYNVAQNISFQRDQIVITKRSDVVNYTFSTTAAAWSFNVTWTNLTYCRNIYNTNCTVTLTGVTTTGQTVVDIVPVNFDLYPGIWLRPMPKAVQPCYTSVIIKSFKPEGTINYALPGDSLILDIVTGGSLNNVFYNLFIKEVSSGAVVTNIAPTPRQYPANVLGPSHKKTFFGLSDTLLSGRTYEIYAYVNCGNLPNIPGVFTQMDITIFKKFPNTMWNLASCNPNDVILLQQPPLAIDSVEVDPIILSTTIDTLQNLVMFPNPTSSEIHFSIGAGEIDLPKEFTLELFDYHGKEIPLEDKKSLPPYLSAGIYFLKISSGAGKSRYVKIIKE